MTLHDSTASLLVSWDTSSHCWGQQLNRWTMLVYCRAPGMGRQTPEQLGQAAKTGTGCRVCCLGAVFVKFRVLFSDFLVKTNLDLTMNYIHELNTRHQELFIDVLHKHKWRSFGWIRGQNQWLIQICFFDAPTQNKFSDNNMWENKLFTATFLSNNSARHY